MTPSDLGRTRLESWKEVATYFHRGERTVRRWETERGLPIRRLPGWSKSRIYADVAELEAWRRGAAAALAEPEPIKGAPNPPRPSSGPETRRRAPWLAGLAGLAIATAALIANEPSLTGAATKESGAEAGPASLAAQRLYLAGMDDWARRTPASLNRAVAEFSGAIARDPGYAEAYAGLAGAYDLMREYTLMPSAQAFPLAKTAAAHALALNDRVAAAHAALAFADFYGDWNAADAKAEFARAIALDPRNETAHHWFATFLMTQGDYAGALREIDAALALDPISPAIAADRDVVLYSLGKKAEAVGGLKALEVADPAFLSPHNYLAYYDLVDARDEGSLAESTIAARLTGDRTRLAMVEAAERALRVGGRPGMLGALVRDRNPTISVRTRIGLCGSPGLGSHGRGDAGQGVVAPGFRPPRDRGHRHRPRPSIHPPAPRPRVSAPRRAGQGVLRDGKGLDDGRVGADVGACREVGGGFAADRMDPGGGDLGQRSHDETAAMGAGVGDREAGFVDDQAAKGDKIEV